MTRESSPSARRAVYRTVRQSLERDGLLATAGEGLAKAVEEYLKTGERQQLEAALDRYRAAAAQAPGPTST
jgi:DNA polymerase/3'-5' exonuclease PolX